MEDPELWEAFGGAALPHAAWTHRAHLRIAWMFLRRYPLDEAHLRMRVGIIRLNASHDLVETPQRGYHETLTRVWLVLVSAAMRTIPAETSDAFIDAAAEVLGKDAVLRHYSRDHVMSVHARATFAAPDLAPLPAVR
jgi:hypothetical protein